MTSISTAVPLPRAKNVSVSVDGSKLWIYCDLSKDFGNSSTGKTLVVASSGGNKTLGATNAVLGLNLFVKNAESRKLDAAAVSGLRELTPVGEHCQWRIDGQILNILIDFNAVGDTIGGSGKSVRLATTSGNKPVASTGIMCGLNCYAMVGKTLQADKLHTVVSSATPVKIGDSVDVGEGFILRVENEKQVTIHYELTIKEDKTTITMPSFVFQGDINLALMLKPNIKKRRVESAPVTTTATDFVAVSEKSKNCLVCCKSAGNNAEEGIFEVDVRFDPTCNFGRSGSGKSINVASSAGWCDAGNGLFSINFNAYKSTLITAEEIAEAVASALGQHANEDLPSLSFKAVSMDILKALGLSENAEDGIRLRIKEAVKEYLHNRNVALSSQT